MSTSLLHFHVITKIALHTHHHKALMIVCTTSLQQNWNLDEHNDILSMILAPFLSPIGELFHKLEIIHLGSSKFIFIKGDVQIPFKM